MNLIAGSLPGDYTSSGGEPEPWHTTHIQAAAVGFTIGRAFIRIINLISLCSVVRDGATRNLFLYRKMMIVYYKLVNNLLRVFLPNSTSGVSYCFASYQLSNIAVPFPAITLRLETFIIFRRRIENLLFF